MVKNSSYYRTGDESEPPSKKPNRKKADSVAPKVPKKIPVGRLADVELAAHMASFIRTKARLPAQTSFYKPVAPTAREPNPPCADFIFDKGSWMDPEDVIDILPTLREEYLQYFCN